MSSYIDEYKKKLVTADQVAAMVKSGDTVDLFGYNCVGQALDKALAKRKSELQNVKIRSMNRTEEEWEVFKVDPESRSFYSEAYFVGPERKMLKRENRATIPALFFEYPTLYRRGDWTADYGSRQVSPMDKDGYFSFSMISTYSKGFAEGVKCFVAEVNTNLFPLKNAHEDSRIHISEVDFIIEGNNPPLFELEDPIAGEVEYKIADHILGELSDRCCFQIGLGKVPCAIIALLAKSDLKDVGVHSELFSDGLMKLYQSGKVTNKYKNLDKGKMTTTLIQGTTELYDFVRECEDLYIAPVNYVNDPYIIGQIDNIVSINACLEVDITGQVNSETIGTDQISGTGGQLDFVMGAYRSKNGKSIICCPSTYKKKDGTLASRIKAVLDPGTGITNPRAAVQYVCTEYGIVNIKGKNMWERAERLISIAHPDLREGLVNEAEKYGIWRRSNKR